MLIIKCVAGAERCGATLSMKVFIFKIIKLIRNHKILLGIRLRYDLAFGYGTVDSAIKKWTSSSVSVSQ
jgi:hypothetical protein